MHGTEHKNISGMGFAALGFSLYSIGDVFIKFAAEAEYSPFQIGLFINFFFFPLLLVFAQQGGGLRATLQSKKKHMHIFRSFFGLVSFCAMTNGFAELGMAKSYTLIFAAPFIATILSIFFLGEKIRIYRWSAIAVGFLGVLTVLRPGFIPLEPAALWILLGACCFAISTIIIRKIGEHEPILAFSFYGTITHSIIFIAVIAFTGHAFVPSGEHAWYFAATAAFHVFAAFAVSTAFSRAETSTVAPFHYIQLLWGVLFGYFIFGQGIDLWTALGGLIIVGSGIYMIHREHVRRRQLTHGVVASGAAVE